MGVGISLLRPIRAKNTQCQWQRDGSLFHTLKNVVKLVPDFQKRGTMIIFKA